MKSFFKKYRRTIIFWLVFVILFRIGTAILSLPCDYSNGFGVLLLLMSGYCYGKGME